MFNAQDLMIMKHLNLYLLLTPALRIHQTVIPNPSCIDRNKYVTLNEFYK